MEKVRGDWTFVCLVKEWGLAPPATGHLAGLLGMSGCYILGLKPSDVRSSTQGSSRQACAGWGAQRTRGPVLEPLLLGNLAQSAELVQPQVITSLKGRSTSASCPVISSLRWNGAQGSKGTQRAGAASQERNSPFPLPPPPASSDPAKQLGEGGEARSLGS